ncbi:hypothetical protein NDU88_006322 [Pleurodeles waltl]|uniref:PHLPP-like RA domain-containing protein n=1 Tax=Pleurodeles waltl TaxID=8319 RepID=A0AAV7VR28_PLEWA|nr:hypothetical protein NDU88_006322 [Pleurodeles waltl]
MALETAAVVASGRAGDEGDAWDADVDPGDQSCACGESMERESGGREGGREPGSPLRPLLLLQPDGGSSLLRRRRRLRREPGTPSEGSRGRSLPSTLGSAGLQPADREWVRAERGRGCLHVSTWPPASAPPRPVLCTLSTTAGELARRLLPPAGRSGAQGALRVPGPGGGSASSSSEELCSDPAPGGEPPALYVQLHGEPARRLRPHERPLHLQSRYLQRLGFRQQSRLQDEGLEPDIACLIRFYAGRCWGSPEGGGTSGARSDATARRGYRHCRWLCICSVANEYTVEGGG